MKGIKFDLEVNVFDECFDERPDKAVVEITRPLAKRILQLAAAAKKLKVYKICEFDYTPEFFIEGDNGEFTEMLDFRVDAETLEVEEERFRWAGSIKNTSIGWETGSISIVSMEELETVWRTRKSRLPLLMGTLKTKEAQELLSERMKEI
jgi:hypothetical protein